MPNLRPGRVLIVPTEDKVRDQLLAIPQGAHASGDFGWNRYDTTDQHVLHLWADGVSYDITTPRKRVECGCFRIGFVLFRCSLHRKDRP